MDLVKDSKVLAGDPGKINEADLYIPPLHSSFNHRRGTGRTSSVNE